MGIAGQARGDQAGRVGRARPLGVGMGAVGNVARRIHGDRGRAGLRERGARQGQQAGQGERGLIQ